MHALWSLSQMEQTQIWWGGKNKLEKCYIISLNTRPEIKLNPHNEPHKGGEKLNNERGIYEVNNPLSITS